MRDEQIVAPSTADTTEADMEAMSAEEKAYMAQGLEDFEDEDLEIEGTGRRKRMMSEFATELYCFGTEKGLYEFAKIPTKTVRKVSLKYAAVDEETLEDENVRIGVGMLKEAKNNVDSKNRAAKDLFRTDPETKSEMKECFQEVFVEMGIEKPISSVPQLAMILADDIADKWEKFSQVKEEHKAYSLGLEAQLKRMEALVDKDVQVKKQIDG